MVNDKITINVRGIACSVEPHSDGKRFIWRAEPKNDTGTAGTSNSADEAWGEAVEWASFLAREQGRKGATWDRHAGFDQDVSPEACAAIPQLPLALTTISQCSQGLGAILRVLRSNGMHEEWHDNRPEDGQPLTPWVAGGLEAAAAALVDTIMRTTEDLARWQPFPRRAGGNHA